MRFFADQIPSFSEANSATLRRRRNSPNKHDRSPGRQGRYKPFAAVNNLVIVASKCCISINDTYSVHKDASELMEKIVADNIMPHIAVIVRSSWRIAKNVASKAGLKPISVYHSCFHADVLDMLLMR